MCSDGMSTLENDRALLAKFEDNDEMVKDDKDERLLLYNLIEFFSRPEHIQPILPIIRKESRITFTLLDWFVVVFSRDNPVEYTFNGRSINLYNEYQIQLSRFKKKRSDPFNRQEKRPFFYDLNNRDIFVKTSPCQLNFFRWALQIGLLTYIEDNFDELKTAHDEYVREKTMRFKLKKNKLGSRSKAKMKSTGTPRYKITGITQKVGIIRPKW